MKPKVNRHLFNIASFDSGAIGQLESVGHSFTEPGSYRAVVRFGKKVVGETLFEVSEKTENTQLNIDLARAAKPARDGECECRDPNNPGSPAVSPTGYVLFQVGSGPGGYSVVVGKEGERKPVFDSRTLGKGDIYALCLLEPTTYAVKNSLGDAKAGAVVAFKQTDAKKIKAGLATTYVETSAQQFEPNEIRQLPTQGLVFRVADKARVHITREREADPDLPNRGRRRFPGRPRAVAGPR